MKISKQKIEKNGISKNDMGNIKRSLDKSLLHEGFLYEVFIDNLKNNKYSANLIKSIAPCYFAISEKVTTTPYLSHRLTIKTLEVY